MTVLSTLEDVAKRIFLLLTLIIRKTKIAFNRAAVRANNEKTSDTEEANTHESARTHTGNVFL